MSLHDEDMERLEKAYDVIVKLETKLKETKKASKEPVAVVGIGCKFAGNIKSVTDFYNLLSRGEDATSEIPKNRWRYDEYDRRLREKIYCNRGAFLDDVYGFDPLFFNISPVEAEYMDPQQRLFLEVAYASLEDAGFTLDTVKNRQCGVFAGVVNTDYFGYLDGFDHPVEAYEVTGNYNSMLSARISYFLNLRGPAITVDTACSSSGVAIHLACQALSNGDCDMALAGGVTLYLTPRPYMLMCEANMLSRSGTTYAFDQRADGFVPGEGCGVVVLKRLSQAIQDKDRIYGIIRDTGTNQDGKSNGITAPSAMAQMELETKMLTRNNLRPEDISYIETHGTGTPLGDPIEIDALNQSFAKRASNPLKCAIGSLKPNIGHLAAAAGVASLIKVMLSLRYKKLFPSIHYEHTNEHIEMEKSPFYVQRAFADWDISEGKKRMAMINSFGFSGTNVNMILEEYIFPEKVKSNKSRWMILPVSATNKSVLKTYVSDIREYLTTISGNDSEKKVREFVRKAIATEYRVDIDNIDLSDSLDSFFQDTTKMMNIIYEIENRYEIPMDVSCLSMFDDGNELCEYIVSNTTMDDGEILAKLTGTFQLHRTQMKERICFVFKSLQQLKEEMDTYLEENTNDIDDSQLSDIQKDCLGKWMHGENVDWSLMYKDELPELVEAPTYPFDCKKYIVLPPLDNRSVKENRCINQVYLNAIKIGENNHTINGRELMSATQIVYLLWNAISDYDLNHHFIMKNIKIVQAIQIDPELALQTRIVPNQDEMRVCLETANGNQVYASATIGFSIPNQSDVSDCDIIEDIEETVTISGAEWYQKMRALGYSYGCQFQQIDEIKMNHYVSIARLKQEKSNLSALNPYVLDAAIQPVVAILEQTHPMLSIAVPESIGSLEIMDNGKAPKFSKVQRVYALDEDLESFNVRLFDENNKTVAALNNVQIRVLEKEARAIEHETSMTIREEVVEYIKKEIQLVTKVDLEEIEEDKSFQVYGMDSFISLKMIGNMEKKLGKLPKTILFDCYNVALLADYIAGKYGEKFQKQEPHVLEEKHFPEVAKKQGTPLLFLEKDLVKYPNEKKVVDMLRAQYEKEGLACARKEIAPYIFLGEARQSLFYIAERDNVVLAFLYLGAQQDLDSRVSELINHFSNKKVFFLLPNRLNKIGEKNAKSISIGTFQRMTGLLDDISGKQYKHLRYAIKHFEKQGKCTTEEYIINSNDEVDRKIIHVIDEWIASKEYVNEYVNQVKEQIINKTFSKDYRFFITYLNNELVAVIVITPMPSSNGYLMDLEFYGETMPLGGLEYSIFNICRILKKEHVNEFSFGVTFGINADVDNTTDMIWADEFQTLFDRGVFNGSGNFQFKNKFKTKNSPLYVSRLDEDTESGFIDMIMFIADPVGVEKALLSGTNPNTLCKKTEHTEEDVRKKEEINLSKYYMNTVYFPAHLVKHDLLTDSWSELYEKQCSSYRQDRIVNGARRNVIFGLKNFFPFNYLVPVASGRYAENLLFSSLEKKTGNVIHNGLFPTTRGNLINQGFNLINICNTSTSDTEFGLPDEKKISEAISNRIDYAVIELCNNAAGGLCLSLEKLAGLVSKLHENGVMVFFDVTRAINHTLCVLEGQMTDDIVISKMNEILSLADGIVGSLTKEYQIPQGGLIGVNDPDLYARIKEKLVLLGDGLDFAQKAIISNQMEETHHIISDIVKRNTNLERLYSLLSRLFPVLYRKGSHCILINASHIRELDGYQFKSQVFANWFYQNTGIRIGVHSGMSNGMSEEEDYLRIALPVGTTDEEIDVILSQIGKLANVEYSFVPIELMKSGPLEFGIIKNQYRPVKIEKPQDIHRNENDSKELRTDELIAVIGISGRFPEAEDVYEFWDHLKEGRDSVIEVPIERKDLISADLPYKWGGFLKDVDKFDARFFQIPPIEAEKMDPQQRLFLQEVWHAIEDSGYRLSELKKKTNRNIGVFVGATWNEYSDFTNENEDFYPEINIGSIATRVAYYLDFCGPVMSVDTHCSSSLSAVYLACEALKRQNCDVAVAGGVNLSISPNKYYFARHFLSDTGKCKSFSEMADGYVPSEAVGAIILKPLEKAQMDGDHIYGVIRAAVQRHGGRTAGVTVPNSASQARVIAEAIKQADVTPESISYVETHGTGTKLGDPIEIAGLAQAFSIPAHGTCSIGSVKSNVGHSEAASGIVQVMKVLMQMKYRTLVPSLHADKINEELNLSNTPFVVQKRLGFWDIDDSMSHVRRAGISSFGAGGVNCHLIMEEYPEKESERKLSDYYIIPISAKTTDGILSYIQQLKHFLTRKDVNASICDIAYTLQTGREIWKHRIAFVVTGKDNLIELCSKYSKGESERGIITQDYIFVSNGDVNTKFSNYVDAALAYVKSGMDISYSEYLCEGDRISLPGYSFTKESYWRFKARQADCNLYSPILSCVENNRNERKKDSVIFFVNSDSASKYTISGCENYVFVYRGTTFKKIDEHTYEVNPSDKNSYSTLFSELKIVVEKALFVFDWLFENDSCKELMYGDALAFFSAVNHLALDSQVSVLCFASIRDSIQKISVLAASSFLKTIQLENENIKIRYVNYLQSDSFEDIWFQERFKEVVDYSCVSYVDNKPYVELFQDCSINGISTNEQDTIRENGVYIITGGASGVGFIIAKSIAKKQKTNLLLVGRRQYNESIQSKISELNSMGANAEYYQANVSVLEEAIQCVQHVKKSFGRINGIIHSAGVLRDSYFVKKTTEEFSNVCEPKLLGVRNLDEASKAETMDFFVVFSSLAAIVGNIGQCDYSYANSYMDHFMEYRSKLCKDGYRYGKSISINWPLWRDGGMQIPESRQELLFEQTGLRTMDSSTGVQAFFNSLSLGKTRVLVVTGDKERVQKSFLQTAPIQAVKPTVELESKLVSEEKTIDVANNKETVITILCELISKEIRLPVDRIDIYDSMEEYGLDSIMIESLTAKLENRFGKISPTVLFECDSIDKLADYIIKKNSSQVNKYCNTKVSKQEEEIPEDIAIIGMNGRFPEAEDLEQLWSNLANGVDSVSEIPADRWNHEKERDSIYCEWGGFLKNVDMFDTLLFNIAPKEAETIDPQERLFLENVWELLEESGYTKGLLEKKYPKDHGAGVGVFVGETTNSYQLLMDESKGKDTVYPISSPWSISNRVSFVFNFTGPSIAIDTACSSSLVAIHMACESLKRKECSIAIAGGVNLYLHKSKYAAMCQLGMLSKSGKCHAFGKAADGFVPGEGVGSILLKPLSKAIEDGDSIYGVIKGTAVNHGGHTNGYKVPSAFSQSMVIKEALNKARLNIWDINYIEAHGTGTVLGDPIEFEGLMQLYENHEVEKKSCPIGSVKTNIGHSESAAGIAGVIKVLLQMRHKTIVPSLHADETNPYINFEDSPFYIPHDCMEWKLKPDGYMRAGISAFGAGGVNAHVIIEEFKH